MVLGSGPIAMKCLDAFNLRRPGGHELVGLASVNLDNRNEDELLAQIEFSRPDVLISIQYPWILSARVIKSVAGRVLNLHNAKLPDYRGHNCLSHEILNGERTHTATLHWIEEEVDRGREVATESIPILPTDTAYSLWLRSADACVSLFERFLEQTSEVPDASTGAPVASGGTFYGKSRIQALKVIPPGADSLEIDRIARAFWFPPHEPAHFRVGERKLYVLPDSYEY